MLGVAVCLSVLSGCASIVNGTSQVISVQTVAENDSVPGALCVLANDKGTWLLRTPGLVTVHRAYGDLTIKCDKDGFEPGILAAKSHTKGAAYGNILFGGLIGAGIDMGNGAAYDYPAFITVMMGPKGAPAVPKPPGIEPQVTSGPLLTPPTAPTLTAAKSLPPAQGTLK